MKNLSLSLTAASLLMLAQSGQAQDAFHKFSLSLSVTGGSTKAIYSTHNPGGGDLLKRSHSEAMDGMIDPLILEFGVSDKVGLGFTAGGDYYNVNPEKFYGYTSKFGQDKLTSFASYFTFDVNYHPFVSDKLDLAFFTGAGSFRVTMTDSPNQDIFAQNEEPAGDGTQNGTSTKGAAQDYIAYSTYTAKGSTIRAGARLRWYFYKRVGFMAMVTGFAGTARPQDMGNNSFGAGYNTSLRGVATEFGFCMRFF